MTPHQIKKLQNKAINGRISASDYKSILKPKKKTVKRTISATEYNKLILEGKISTDVKRSPYTFRYDIKKISADVYIFTLYGKHLSNNRINALNRGELFRYRAAIKRAISNYFILNTKIVPEQCFLKAEMFAVAYNPRSRDSDANTINLKILRDVFESRGFILNDSRKILIEHKCDEVISKEYKIEIRLMNTTPKEQ